MGASASNDSKKEKEKYIPEKKLDGSPEPIPGWKNEIINEQLKKAICNIKIDVKENHSTEYGTGFLCKIPFPDDLKFLPLLVTSNHVINEKI